MLDAVGMISRVITKLWSLNVGKTSWKALLPVRKVALCRSGLVPVVAWLIWGRGASSAPSVHAVVLPVVTSNS